jgi:hypothetical protein
LTRSPQRRGMAGICAFAPKTRVALGPTPAIWSPIQSGHQVGFCPLGVLESPEGGEENSLFIIRHCDQRRLHSRRLLALACPSRGRELQSPPHLCGTRRLPDSVEKVLPVQRLERHILIFMRREVVDFILDLAGHTVDKLLRGAAARTFNGGRQIS